MIDLHIFLFEFLQDMEEGSHARRIVVASIEH